MDQLNETGHDEMLNCPKCGFQQPRDQYCAKCGVDMVKAAQARSNSTPLAVIGAVVVASGLGFFGYSKFAAKPSDSGSAKLASTEQRRPLNPAPSASEQPAQQEAESSSAHSSGDIASQATTQLEAPHTHESPAIESESAALSGPSAVAQLAARETKSPSQHSLKGRVSPEMRKQLDQPTSQTAPQEEGVLVAFAWAEMSKELLQSLQAAEPGFHQVPGLEARLRQASGSYRILDVERRRMKDDSEAVTLSKGELSLYFEPVKIGAKEFIGGYTAQYRNAQGELRSPASATVSIPSGSGAIVTMGASMGGASMGGASPTAPTNGVVVLIMPRW